jgi:hypothetical protein
MDPTCSSAGRLPPAAPFRELRRRAFAALCIGWLASALACESAGKTGDGAAAAAPSNVAAAGADAAAPASAAAPATSAAAPAAEPIPSAIPADASVEEAIRIVNELLREYRSVHSPAEPRRPPGAGGPAREAYQALDRARHDLARRYAGKPLAPAEHLALCNTLAAIHDQFREEAVFHCEAFLASPPAAAAPSKDHALALSVLGVAQLDLKRFDRAARAFEAYLERYGAPDASAAYKLDAMANDILCRRILTHYLPEAYHRLGDAMALRGLAKACASRGIADPRDLRLLRGYLLSACWRDPDAGALKAQIEEILALPAWKGSSEPQRDLIAQALSSKSRLEICEGDLYGPRQVYMDYAWNHDQVEAAWRVAHLESPVELLLDPASRLAVPSWHGHRAPAVLPGIEKPATSKVILLSFFAPTSEIIEEFLPALNELARRQSERLQVIGLVPPARSAYSVEKKETLVNLPPEGFRAEAERYLEAAALQYAVGFLAAGLGESTCAAYRIQRLPTLVLIDRENRIVAYQALDVVDGGWEKAVEALGRP